MGVPFVSLFDDLAEAIAQPPPNRPLARGVGNFGRRMCDGISNNPSVYAPTVLQQPLLAVCQPYWDQAGYSAPVVDSPFSGGQCALEYAPSGTYERNCPVADGVIRFWRMARPEIGPVGGLSLFQSSWVVNFGGGIQVGIVDSDTGEGLISAGEGTENACSQLVSQTAGVKNVKLLAVNPRGHDDSCGDPPVTVTPGPNPAPSGEPLPPGTGPRLGPRGLPILVLPSTLEISPTLDLELPDGEINLGGGGNPTAPESLLPGEPIPGDDLPGGNGDSDFGEPPDGERWVGCCVSITQRPVGSGTIPQAEPESIYPTVVGNVRMKFKPFGSSTLSYDTPLRKREKTTCIWEPVRGLNPIGARVNTIPGYKYVVVPYSVPEEQ